MRLKRVKRNRKRRRAKGPHPPVLPKPKRKRSGRGEWYAGMLTRTTVAFGDGENEVTYRLC